MNTDSLTSTFFYDGICRLIPGIVVISLYGNHLVTRAYDALHGSSVSLAVCIFLIAWFIGATLDTVTFAPFAFLLEKLPKTLLFRKQLLLDYQQGETDAQKSKTNPQKNETEAEKFERLHNVRLRAEKVTFRVMMFISVSTFFWPPTIFPCDQWTRYYYSFTGTFAFLLCWLWLVKALQPKDKKGVHKTVI